jgi:glycogen debranching enzyme
MENSPHLRPAFLLDAVMARLSAEVVQGKWQDSGVPKMLCSEDHLQVILFELQLINLTLVSLG